MVLAWPAFVVETCFHNYMMIRGRDRAARICDRQHWQLPVFGERATYTDDLKEDHHM